ncbi:MAG TPA: ATP-binding protein [Thermoanaerobaculia bacterium]|nr:ATP-binding protein [Thermoanaerobaculia bacterium]
MTEAIPLGARENQQLEFKGRDALDRPELVGRAVVAMLNAQGGTVWVGLREEQGRAVTVEPLSTPDGAERRLLDYLVDAIEPAPSAREVELRRVPTDGGVVLRIEARPEATHRPYALLSHGGRIFVTRVADRARLMTREEVLGGSTKILPSDQELQHAMAKVLTEQAAAQRNGGESFWLRLEPAAEVELHIQEPKVADLLQEPRLSGNRPMGWNFAGLHRLEVRKGKLVTNPADLDYVEVRRDGGLVFGLPLRRLHWKGDDPREIWPLALLEFPISAFRIARVLYEGVLRAQDRVVAELALFGIKGWKLRPGSPGSWSRLGGPESFTESADFTLERPLVFRFEEIEAEPDRCGYRLIERVYEAFGLRREAIPEEFDRSAGRLVLPE